MTDDTNNYSIFQKFGTCYRIFTDQATHEDTYNIAQASPNINITEPEETPNLTPTTTNTYQNQIGSLTFWTNDHPN